MDAENNVENKTAVCSSCFKKLEDCKCDHSTGSMMVPVGLQEHIRILGDKGYVIAVGSSFSDRRDFIWVGATYRLPLSDMGSLPDGFVSDNFYHALAYHYPENADANDRALLRERQLKVLLDWCKRIPERTNSVGEYEPFAPTDPAPVPEMSSDDLERILALNLPDRFSKYLEMVLPQHREAALSGLAANPATPPVVLDAFFAAGYEYGLSKNPAAPQYVLEQLVENDWLFPNIEENPAASEEILDWLACSSESADCVDRNPSVTPSVLLKMIERGFFFVLENPRVPASTLVRYSTDIDACVRRCVAANPSTPVSVLRRLANDDDLSVVEKALENPSLPLETFTALYKDEGLDRLLFAPSPIAPENLLEALSLSDDVEVRQCVAWNPSATAAILDRLSYDACYSVKCGVASNPSAPAGALERLSSDENHDLKICVARNANTPRYVLEKMLACEGEEIVNAIAENEGTDAALLQRMVENRLCVELETVAENPNLPESAFAKIAASDNEAAVRELFSRL